VYAVDNLAFKKAVASSRVVNHYRPDLIVDGNTRSCIYLDTRIDDRFIQIDLKKNYLISGLVIHVPDGKLGISSISIQSYIKITSNTWYSIFKHSIMSNYYRLRATIDGIHSREIGVGSWHSVSKVLHSILYIMYI
jgi:hypothetical protein